MSQAVAMTAEVAAGAIGAGGEIVASAVDLVQNAAESLATVATGGVREPEGSAEDARKGSRKRKGS